jgi:hypothetical protein
MLWLMVIYSSGRINSSYSSGDVLTIAGDRSRVGDVAISLISSVSFHGLNFNPYHIEYYSLLIRDIKYRLIIKLII